VFGGIGKLPLYEYQCEKDGVFEKMQKFSDPPLSTCPTCGGPVEKLLSAPAIQFKGTGWYVTDYARKSSGGDSGGRSDGEAKDKGASKDAASSTKEAGGSKDSSSSPSSKGSDKK
jgi:putative FmdB family regulatory protein